MRSPDTQLQAKMKHFDFEAVLKCNFFRQVNLIYEYKPERQAFDVNNDTRRFFYGRCRVVRQSDLTRQKVRAEGTGGAQRQRNQGVGGLHLSVRPVQTAHVRQGQTHPGIL